MALTFDTPQGRAPTVDASSVTSAYFGKDAAQLKVHRDLLEKLALTSPTASPVVSLARIEQQGYAQFDAVYIPGDHASMQDLLKSPALGRLLGDLHQRNKTTALVCHGPIALLSTLHDADDFVSTLEAGAMPATPQGICSGYQMTVTSNQEEEQAKPLLGGAEMKFHPQTALQRTGARFSSNAAPWTGNVVVDRELITGQILASALEVAQRLVERLK